MFTKDKKRHIAKYYNLDQEYKKISFDKEIKIDKLVKNDKIFS